MVPFAEMVSAIGQIGQIFVAIESGLVWPAFAVRSWCEGASLARRVPTGLAFNGITIVVAQPAGRCAVLGDIREADR